MQFAALENKAHFKVFLRAFEIDDYQRTHKWRCNDEMQNLLGANRYFVSTEQEKKWVTEKTFSGRSDLYLAICLTDTNEMIGYIGIKDFDWVNRNALLKGVIIGDKKHRNIGLGTTALFLLLDFLFSEMGFHRIYGYWLEEHKPSLRIAEKLGFKKEGLLRKALFKNNAYRNLVIAAVLAVDFEPVRAHFPKNTC